MKVAVGIFKKDNSVLLMRRAQTEPFAGEWEFPGGKFEDGEDGPECLHRELKEELCIDAKIGDLITIVKLKLNSEKDLELYAYEVISYTGEITLTVHEEKEWVKIFDLPKHPQLPADLVISKILVNKEKGINNKL